MLGSDQHHLEQGLSLSWEAEAGTSAWSCLASYRLKF